MKEVFPRRFGPYVLVAPLGDGGMGEVCLALAPEGGRCALKRIWAGEGPRSDAEARFRREGDVARRLRHPALARTLAFGEVSGELYLAQEYVEGVDLVEIRKSEISVPTALHIVSEIARALDHVHGFEGLGLVHRDVAPANIRLSFDGECKLLDFGLVSSPAHAGMTAPGTVLGRMPYLAPEVKKGGRADVRSDVYSLGVVLWELLTRRRFAEEREGLRGDLSALAPSRFNREVTAELDRVVIRATADDPGARFLSAGQLAAALDGLLPPGFDGRGVLRTLLEALYDVRQLRAVTARQVRAGEKLLGADGPREPVPGPRAEVLSDDLTTERVRAASPGSRRRRVRVALLAATGGVLGLGAFVVGMMMRQPEEAAVDVPVPRAAVAAAVEPAPPVPVPEAPAAVSAPEPVFAAPPEPAGSSRGRRKAARAPAPILDSESPVNGTRGEEIAPAAAAAEEGRASALAAEEAVRAAEARFHTRDLAGAEALARRAIELGAAPRGQFLLGMALFAQKRFGAARDAFAEAVRLDPANLAASRQLELARAAVRGEK
jgi:hypothetical protein